MSEATIRCHKRNRSSREKTKWDSRYNLETAENVRNFHATFPSYQPTPLISLPGIAKKTGTGAVYVKDESFRFGLNAFKALGGSYAVGKFIAEKIALSPSEMSFQQIGSPAAHENMKDTTFVTATDGNHGRGVAWAAMIFGAKSLVLLPKGTKRERLENILALGSDASITQVNYDNTVIQARTLAEENGWPLIQDTSWPGYEEVPATIMQGYLTMALEILEQIPKAPTHVFLQAGVGSMAAALACFFKSVYSENDVSIIIVEPDKADCLYETSRRTDGTLYTTEGDLDTIMAGLACGTPCSVAWDLLSRYADYFVTMPDSYAARAMRILGNPLRGDEKIESGESGAAGFGAFYGIVSDEVNKDIREEVGIGPDSVVLCISTEGATDVQNYRDIVWEGLYSSK